MRMMNKLWTEKDDAFVFRELSNAQARGISMFKASMRIARRVGRSPSAISTRYQSLRLQRRESPVHRVASREAFLTAPSEWLKIARAHGPVAIVDRFGKVCAVLSVPRGR